MLSRLLFEKEYDVMHDYVTIDDHMNADVDRPYAVEILADVATNFGDMSVHSNPVSFGRPSVFSFRNDAPNHSLRSPADET